MNNVYFLVQQMLLFSIPLLIVAIGGLFSERSGVISIALEGIMIMGAFFGILFIHVMQKNELLEGYSLLIVALIIAAIFGSLFALLHAFASVSMSANQTISGTALNLFAPAFAIFTARSIVGIQQVSFRNTFRITKVPLLGDIPIIGKLFFQNTYITTYIGIVILFITYVIIYKTKFGLRMRAVGENPHSADAAGVSVSRIRYVSVAISGALAGLGGLVYILPITVNFDGNVAGYGFLAISVLIFGQWKPFRIFGGSIFFGLLLTISSAYTGIPFLYNLNIPKLVYEIAPYLITILVLFFTPDKSRSPDALGEPFDKGKR